MDARRMLGFEAPLMAALQQLLDVPGDEAAGKAGAYARDAHAMAVTPADVKELPSSYAFVVDMPGVRPGDMKVQVEDGRVLVISGERRREEETEGEAAKLKYMRMERRMGKLMRKFALPDDTDKEKVSAVYRDGVLTVTVEKLPPPEPKKPRTIQVNIA